MSSNNKLLFTVHFKATAVLSSNSLFCILHHSFLFLLDYLHHYTDTLWFPLILKKKSYPDPFSLSNHCPKSLLPFIENLSKCFCIAVSNHSSEIGRREWVGWLIMSYKLKKNGKSEPRRPGEDACEWISGNGLKESGSWCFALVAARKYPPQRKNSTTRWAENSS